VLGAATIMTALVRLAKWAAATTVVVLACGACGSTPPPTQRSDEDLGVGVFVGCEMPAPVTKALGSLLSVLSSRGIDVGVEGLVIYDHDLASGGNTLELAFGGESATTLAGVLAIDNPEIASALASLPTIGAGASLLAAATIDLDFGSDWQGISFSLLGCLGASVGVGGAGRWQVLWSTDSSSVGTGGYFGAVDVASYGACSGGAVAVVSDEDLGVLATLWNRLFGGDGGDTGDDGG
jgi:hypothetical protein